MEVYLQVRRAHFDEGRSKRSIARDFGLARGTVVRTGFSTGVGMTFGAAGIFHTSSVARISRFHVR